MLQKQLSHEVARSARLPLQLHRNYCLVTFHHLKSSIPDYARIRLHADG